MFVLKSKKFWVVTLVVVILYYYFPKPFQIVSNFFDISRFFRDTPAHIVPINTGVPSDKFKYNIPLVATSTNISLSELPSKLRTLVFEPNSDLALRSVVYKNGETGYRIQYDYTLSKNDIKNFGYVHPELGSSLAKITPRDIIGLSSMPVTIRGNGWKIENSYRNDYIGFFEASVRGMQARISYTYKDFYTTRIFIEVINK